MHHPLIMGYEIWRTIVCLSALFCTSRSSLEFELITRNRKTKKNWGCLTTNCQIPAPPKFDVLRRDAVVSHFEMAGEVAAPRFGKAAGCTLCGLWRGWGVHISGLACWRRPRMQEMVPTLHHYFINVIEKLVFFIQPLHTETGYVFFPMV